jgi:tetratricopeptide (TPR) repeat protein
MSAKSTRAVFLSYASQDADAALKLCDALRGAGVEVWFDQNQLVGGDAWDQKIRGQIASCTFFVPIISANTQARGEGYFRLEWKLAVDRSHLMAHDQPFLLPVVVDATPEALARVPAEFRAVQWTRLPGAGALSAFCERVKSLLDRSEAVDGDFQGVQERENTRGKARSTSASPSRRWLLPVLASVAALVALVLWQPWKKGLAPEAKSSAPLSEARKLTLQARALIDDDLLAVRENFRLADELCQRATNLDPSDAEAWATHARVSLELLARSFESNTQRREAARGQAERAFRLRPDSIEARLAMASLSLQLLRDAAGAEQKFRQLLLEAPHDPRLALWLARTLVAQQKLEEATNVRLNHPSFNGRDPRPLVDESVLLRSQGRWAEADALLHRSLAIAPSTRGYSNLLVSYVSYWGDFEAAQALIAKIPPRVLQEDIVVGLSASLWLRLGNGREAQAVLQRAPRDFLQEETQDVPKGFLMGWALQIAGKAAAAQAEWTQALAVVERQLVNEPNRVGLLRYRAQLLALIGKGEEGEKWWQVAWELPRNNNANTPYHGAMFYAATGRIPEAIQWLEKGQAENLPQWQRTSVRFDPAFAEVRREPRVQRLMADWEAEIAGMRAEKSGGGGVTGGIAR